MALNFPDSPTVGTIFIAGDTKWQWDGTVWNVVTEPSPSAAQTDVAVAMAIALG